MPVIEEYCKENLNVSEIKFPVIVKPTDYAGCKGISICMNKEQLNDAVEYALKYSESKTIICEDYATGTELMAIYTIKDDSASLSSLSEKYISKDHKGIPGLCDAVVAPSKYYQKYLDETDSHVKSLLNGIGAKNGMAFFQFIANDNIIIAFEMGYRLNGNNDCRIIEKYNGINYMKMMISYSLTGSMGDDIKKRQSLVWALSMHFMHIPKRRNGWQNKL